MAQVANNEQAMVVRAGGALVPSEPFEPQNLEQARVLAEDIAKSGLVPPHLRGNPYNVYVTLMWGRELGLSPMQSVMGVWVEPKSGRPGLYEQTALALVKRRHEICKYFRLVETTDEIATYETQRIGDPEPIRMSFTIAQAQKARLTEKDNWKSYPAAMLRARCAMHLARTVYEDVLANVYNPDELQEIAERGDYVDVRETMKAPPPPAEKPKAASAPKKDAAPKPAAAPAPTEPAPRATVTHADRVASGAASSTEAKPNSPEDLGFRPPPDLASDAPAPSSSAAPPASDDAPVRPIDAILERLYAACLVVKDVGKAAARHRLDAVMPEIPPLERDGKITKEDREETKAVYRLCRDVIDKGLDLDAEVAKREAQRNAGGGA